jgi:hypothetical protein
MSRLLPLLALIFAIALFFLYIRPTFSGPIADTRAQIASYNDALTAASRFQQKEAQLTQQRAQIPADSLARLSDFLPDGVDNVQLILDLDALAARSGVTLSEFNTVGSDSTGSTATNAAPAAGPASTPATIPTLGTQSLAGGSPTDSLSLTFKATGTYPAFRSFLAGMENSLRPLDVTDLQVTESDTGVYSYALTVRIYWLR